MVIPPTDNQILIDNTCVALIIFFSKKNIILVSNLKEISPSVLPEKKIILRKLRGNTSPFDSLVSSKISMLTHAIFIRPDSELNRECVCACANFLNNCDAILLSKYYSAVKKILNYAYRICVEKWSRSV
jgi:hypothetical protein